MKPKQPSFSPYRLVSHAPLPPLSKFRIGLSQKLADVLDEPQTNIPKVPDMPSAELRSYITWVMAQKLNTQNVRFPAELAFTHASKWLQSLDPAMNLDLLDAVAVQCFGNIYCLSAQQWQKVRLQDYEPLDAALILWLRSQSQLPQGEGLSWDYVLSDLDVDPRQQSLGEVLAGKSVSDRVSVLFDMFCQYPDLAARLYLSLRSMPDVTTLENFEPPRLSAFLFWSAAYRIIDEGTSIKVEQFS